MDKEGSPAQEIAERLKVELSAVKDWLALEE